MYYSMIFIWCYYLVSAKSLVMSLTNLVYLLVRHIESTWGPFFSKLHSKRKWKLLFSFPFLPLKKRRSFFLFILMTKKGTTSLDHSTFDPTTLVFPTFNQFYKLPQNDLYNRSQVRGYCLGLKLILSQDLDIGKAWAHIHTCHRIHHMKMVPNWSMDGN